MSPDPALSPLPQSERHVDARLPVARETIFQTRINDVLIFALRGALEAARKLKLAVEIRGRISVLDFERQARFEVGVIARARRL